MNTGAPIEIVRVMRNSMQPGDFCVHQDEFVWSGAIGGLAPVPFGTVVAVVGDDHWVIMDGPRLVKARRHDLMSMAEWKRYNCGKFKFQVVNVCTVK